MNYVGLRAARVAAAVGTFFAMSSAYAFHDGGVAYCDGCHTMHNSSGGKVMALGGTKGLRGIQASPTGGAAFQGQNFLLQGSDDSSTCLNCHSGATLSSYHVMTFPAPAAGTAPVNRTPGGDFAWLTLSFAANVAQHMNASPGERHGHNIVAGDFGLVADTTLLTAPGGSYAAANLSCASCHDPHSRARVIDANGTIAYSAIGSKVLPTDGSGSYGAAPTATTAVGVYRLLGGSNYSQMSYTNPLPFNSNPPVAVAPSTYNRSEATSDTRVAYGTGMSEWCANCHRAIHNGTTNTNNTQLIHPAGSTAYLTAAANDLAGNATGTTIANIYNAYKTSGDLTGTAASSYTSMVPFEEGATVTIATLAGHAGAGTGSTAGPQGGENVMCLSCHRAHATGFSSMTRWDNSTEYITEGGAYRADANGVLTSAQYTAAMYDRPATVYAVTQRSLCNKCHAKD
jgi:hypothetical protein